MSFIWPTMLFLLVVVPVLIGLYLRQQRRRRKLAAAFSDFGFGQAVPAARLGGRRHVPAVLFSIALLLLIFSLARPQTQVTLPEVGGTVLLAFDVSGSMSADDLQPTRIEAAKAAAVEFINRQPASVRIGVIAFSDNGFSVQSPTDDPEAVLAAVARLAPARGTSLGQGIYASLRLLGVELEPPGEEGQPTPTPPPGLSSSAIVLLTDGENNISPDPLEAAQTAADLGVRIHTVGIGSPAGAVIKVDGMSVHTQLDEPALKQISQLTGGEYYNAQNTEQLRSVYENLNPQLVMKTEQMEITSLFAGISMALFLLGGILSLLWLNHFP